MRSSLFPCSGKLRTSSSQHCLVLSGRIFSPCLYSLCIMFYYYKVWWSLIFSFLQQGKMRHQEDKENNSKFSTEGKRDMLHRIGKVQENKMLRAKDNNTDDLKLQNESGKKTLQFELEFQEEGDDQTDDFYIAKEEASSSAETPKNVVMKKKETKQLDVFCFEQDDEEIQISEEEEAEEQKQENKGNIENTEDQDQQKIYEDVQLKLKNSYGHKNRKKSGFHQNNEKARLFQKGFDQEQQPVRRSGSKQMGKDQKKQDSYEEELEQGQIEDVKGIRIVSDPFAGNVTINITNKIQLVESPLPPGIILKCLVRRSPTFINPQFDFYLHNGLKHLLSGKKSSLAKNDIFKIYSEMGKYEPSCLFGTIICNKLHNVYWVTTDGKKNSQCELKGLISYEKIKNNQQRKMKIYLNHTPLYGQKKKMCFEGLSFIQSEELLRLQTAQLKGVQTSPKNFTLVDEEDKEYQYLKMTKTSDNIFELIIQHPLSPLQAYCIALTRFDAQVN